MKKLLEEFKTFAMRGNVIDLAVAVVIGGAFGKIVSSLTDDIIMPIISLVTGGIDFSGFVIPLKKATESSPSIVLKYGLFINSVVTFLIVAFAIFMIVKGMNVIYRRQKEEAIKKPTLTKQEELLIEIRDLLKK